MKALLWKDCRIFADVFWAGLALLVGSYFLALLLVVANRSEQFAWSNVLAAGASLTRLTSMFVCALLGGYAFGRENEERSLLFLASLPAKKSWIVLSKVLVAGAVIALTWTVSLIMMALGFHAMGYESQVYFNVLRALVGYVGLSVLAFGVAWLLSLRMNSAIVAAFCGLMALVPVCVLQFMIARYFGAENAMVFGPGVTAFMVLAGIGCVASGCWSYLRLGGAIEDTRTIPSSLGLADRVPFEEAMPWSLHFLYRKRPHKLTALVCKDLQLMRTSLFLGLLVLALPYVIAIVSGADLTHFRGAGVVSIGLSVIVFSFWSGHVMSAEVVSRTEEFLASVPVRLVTVNAAKLTTVLVPVVILALANITVLTYANNAVPGGARFSGQLTWDAWPNAPFIIMGVSLSNGALIGFATALFLSAYFRRPATAIVVGIVSGFVWLALFAALSTVCAESASYLTPLTFVTLFSAGTVVLAAFIVAVGFVRASC